MRAKSCRSLAVRGQRQVSIRQVDALVVAQLFAPGAGLGDAHGQGAAVYRLHHAFDFAVIEPYLLARFHPGQGLG